LSRLTALRDSAGFTLIEALVALAIVAVALTSIGTLVASTARGVHWIDDRLARLETARALMTALPSRGQLVPGTSSGRIVDHPWRVDVLPFAAENLSPQPGLQWVPQAVVVTVTTPSGAAMKINTIRLQQRNTK